MRANGPHIALQFGAGMGRQAAGVVFKPAPDIDLGVRIPVAPRGDQVFDKIRQKFKRVISSRFDHGAHQHPHEIGCQGILTGL